MKFSNGKTAVAVKTVGELIKELERLPSDFPVDQDYPDKGVEAIIFNISKDSKHLAFKEVYFFTDGFE